MESESERRLCPECGDYARTVRNGPIKLIVKIGSEKSFIWFRAFDELTCAYERLFTVGYNLFETMPVTPGKPRRDLSIWRKPSFNKARRFLKAFVE